MIASPLGLGRVCMNDPYVTLWIDNTSTHFYVTGGTREGNTISETGSWPDR